MAEYSAAGTTAEDPLEKEYRRRLAAARRQKNEFSQDIREGYFFGAPHRAREIRSEQAIAPTKPNDADTLNTGIAMELSMDFNTVIINAFMPPAEPWAERRPGMLIPDDMKGDIKSQVDKADPIIFEAIRASSFYEELPKAFNPDLAIGTAAILIDDTRPAENVVVQAIPLHELEINLGPLGDIDDRFIVRHTRNEHVAALLGPDIFGGLDAETRKKIEEKPEQPTCVAWGWWRLWDRRDDVVWQHVVVLGDKKVVHRTTIVGEGSCALIPFRFNPSPEWAYGQGPMICSLPEFRQLDELQGRKIEHIDNQLSPASTYPENGFTSVEAGVESGKLYPVPPGAGGDVKRIFEAGSMESAIFETSAIEQQLRHRFFLDWPEQRGKTPPTAHQWIDEMMIAQRRIGTPGMSFWKECPAQVFLRFKYLLEKRGVIEPIVVNGKVVSLQPYNPAQRAAEMQEVSNTMTALQVGAGTFPEEFRLTVDGFATMKKVFDKLRASLIVFRPQDQRTGIIDGIKQLIQGRQRAQPPDANIAGPQ